MKAINILENELRNLYIKEKKDQKEIGAIYKCSSTTIRNYLIKYNIPLRGKSESQILRNKNPIRKNRGRPGKLNGRYKHGKYVEDRIYQNLIKVESCSNCGRTKSLVIHHINFNHYDNTPSNLEVLCRSCHFSKHMKAYWEEQKIKSTLSASNS